MPQNVRDGDSNGEANDASAIGVAALERLRNMLYTPVANRPPDWVNPLEKIEQLLTCSVCLDRYKNPKLLPCQHTFCMEPCLDGLIDLVRRMVRCPECRAEHPLPYDGLKGFQTNYTLAGFLEIHLQATEENASELESYVRRYNLERCKICDEKAEVDYCAHCEKRICLECKTTHADMLKRDLGRLMNQVKRACSRIVDSSDTLARGVESLNVNCENVKEEVRDYIRRYTKELKKREETLVTEVEAFYNGETRMINTVRDNLELEAKNMNEACARVESCLKGEKELTDDELVRYKTMFTEGLDYLRMANPDADELINKKIRFAINDAHMLPHAILQFGELQVCTPQFNHKFVQAEKMYVPRFLQLGMESDHYPGKKRSDQNEAPAVPSWKQAKSVTAADDDAYSSRYRRRQMLEEQAWNRIRVEQEQGGTPTSSSPVRRSPRFLDELVGGASPNSRAADISNPWTRGAPRNGGGELAVPEPVTIVAGAVGSSSPVPFNVSASSPNNQAGTSGTDGRRSQDRELDQRIADIRKEYERRLQEQDCGGVRPTQKRVRNRTAPVDAPTASAAAAAAADGASSEEEEDEGRQQIQVQLSSKPRPEENQEKQPSKPATRPIQVDASGGRVSRTNEASASGSSDWRKHLIPSPAPLQGRRCSTVAADLTSGMDLTNAASVRPDRELRSSSSQESVAGDGSYSVWDERRRQFIRSRTNPDFSLESPPRPDATSRVESTASDRRRRLRTDSFGSGGSTDETHSRHGSPSKCERKNRYRRKAERSGAFDGNDDDAAQRYEGSNEPGSNGARVYRSIAQPQIDYLSKGRSIKFGSKGNNDGQFNWPRGIAALSGTDEIAVCDSSNHRMQIFDKRGRFTRTIGSYGSGRGEFDCLADVCVNKYRQFVVTDRYNHRVQIFDASGRHLREFGAHGQTNGRFNSPWGIVVDQQGFIYVCDKDNHRVQIFQADGNFVGKFGTMGNRDGQFQNPHFIACNRQNQLIVTDSGNHRVQVFDHNGHFLFAFGSEGFHEGQFKYPRGVAVDDQGFIVVADSGNNRIQVFYPDGRFYSTFGVWGSGDGQLKGVEGVAVTADGRVLVTDRENHRVQIF